MLKSMEWRLKFQASLAILALVGLQVLFTLHLRMHSLPAAEPDSEKVEEFNPKLFEVMSFGQLPAIVDWMWIKTLQDPFITHVVKGTHPAIYYTLDLVTELDPAFMDAYTTGATLVSVIRDDGPGALHLVLKGEEFRRRVLPGLPAGFRKRYWASEWQVPLLLAYVYLFDMDDMPHAAEAFKETEQIDGSPYYLKHLVQKLEKPGGQYEVGLKLLEHMIAGANDPDVREKLLHRRASLVVSYFLFEMTERHRKKEPLPATDPWGGTISVTSDGKVMTTTPHPRVFGLE